MPSDDQVNNEHFDISVKENDFPIVSQDSAGRVLISSPVSNSSCNYVENTNTFKKPHSYKESPSIEVCLMKPSPMKPTIVHLFFQEWKNIVQNKMGNEIFEFYENNGYLKRALRIQLVNVTTSQLVEQYGLSVPEFAKQNLGETIISIFPKLRNPVGKTGYV